jgi:CRISPR-associated protein (TIGR02710 family)
MQQPVSPRRVLVLNVGKPTEGDVAQRPEAYALREAHPDYVVFVCSQPGDTQSGSLDFVKEYARLAGLASEQYEVLALSDPDDLVRCYEALVARFADLRQRFPGAELLADYTAGTKSMSAALVLAALDSEGSPEVQLRLVRGARGRQATVVPGTESFAPVSGVHDVRARRLVTLARSALERFDYAEAAAVLDEAMRRELSADLRQKLERARNLCRAFDAWDRYELDTAMRLFELYRRDWHRQLAVLEQLHAVVGAFAPGDERSSGQPRLTGLDQVRDPYLAVEDILFNAERRAAQSRYDDALARVYRALELLVQLRLWLGHRIDTSDVDLTRVPEERRQQLAARAEGNGPVRLALVQAWDLLASLPGEPLAEWLRAERGRLLDWTKHRNHSLLAHGFAPVTATSWREHGETGIALCRAALRELHAASKRRPLEHRQFPRSELVPALG